jgi:cytochrome c553
MTRLLVFALAAFSYCAFSAPSADPAKGQALATRVCAACHGGDGNSPLAANPNLAGQHAEYLTKQLRDFKAAKRASPIMAPIAATLSDQDMHDVAAYYAVQRPAGLTASDLTRARAGQRLFRGGIADKGVAACAGCHSPNGAGIPVQYPRIAGQHAEYTAAQLKAFRGEGRSNDENSVMRTIAGRLSDKEIEALADYLAGLR